MNGQFTRIKKVNNRLQERSDFMGDTKEAILTTALQLFAGNDYEAVSVSEIAGALGDERRII